MNAILHIGSAKCLLAQNRAIGLLISPGSQDPGYPLYILGLLAGSAGVALLRCPGSVVALALVLPSPCLALAICWCGRCLTRSDYLI